MQRARALLRHNTAIWSLLVYIGLYVGVVTGRNWTFVVQSVALEHVPTALRGIFEGILDGYTSNVNDVALHVLLVLLAINIVFLGFYVRRVKEIIGVSGGAGVSIGALVLFIVGAGCVTCGAVLGLALVSVLGAGALLSFITIVGPVFMYGGLAVLFIGTVLLGKKITDPFVC